MDPSTGLGIASGIVQFVDFSWRLLHEFQDLYKSGTGMTADNDVIEIIARDLALHNNELLVPSFPSNLPEPFFRLASRCKAVADELLRVLDEIKVKNPHKKWTTFVQALRSVWKKERVTNLLERMERLRGQMHFSIQLMLSEHSSETYKALENLVAENRRLAIYGTHRLENELRNVREALCQVGAEVKGQRFNLQQRPSKGMTSLSHGLSSLAEEVSATAINQMLLNSLYFKTIRERQANVASSHGDTFKWVLEPSSPTGFEKWLRYQSGVYWIVGKAGSGKSTLMKFIINHARTADALKAWVGSRTLATANFFFWNAGNTMQKSQEGLFRSLLFEILRQCPDLIQTVCAPKLTAFQPFTEELEFWTREELLQSLGQLKQHSGVKVRFCFFIDGLDEYDGDPEHLVEVLESLRCWPDIKLCVSSRPWNEFEDAFSQPSDLRLALEDLTREDIRIYVRDTLEENPRFRALEAKDGRSQDLVQEIVEKARGVFLWVVLVVKSLLTGLRNADRISHLQKRLRDFPGSLEKYFGHILGSVEKCYREETAKAFKFALVAAAPLSLMTYSFLDEGDHDPVATSPDRVLTTKDILMRNDDMRRRLNGRCKGLLEVINDDNSKRGESEICTPKVDFLHRTVYDFLLTKDIQAMLSQNLEAGFESRVHLCRALLAQLRCFNYNLAEAVSYEPQDLLEDLVYYARELEIDSKMPQITLLDEVSQLVLKQAKDFVSFQGEVGFLGFLVHRKLSLYIAAVLKRNPPLKVSALNQLLVSAVLPASTKYLSPAFDPQIVQLLLEHGALPNGSYRSTTVWGHLVFSLQKVGFSNEESHLMIEVVESMLLHGADPEMRVAIAKGTGLTRRATGRAADLYKAPGTKSAKAILCQVLGEEKTREVLSKAQPQARSLLSSLASWIIGP